MIPAIVDAYRLKDESRTGWLLRGVKDPESVADHSWGTAYLVLLYADQAGVDRARALEIALVHDLAEAVTGDVPTRVRTLGKRDKEEAKHRAELEAMQRLTSAYPPDEKERVLARWWEYEKRTTDEARFVRDMNLIDMCLQALVYESRGRYKEGATPHFPEFQGLDEFFATTHPRLDLPMAYELFEEILRLYNELPSVRDRGGVALRPHTPGSRPDTLD